MKNLTIMIGLPRSGKSTIIKERYGNEIIVSRDTIREKLFGDKNNHSDEERVTNVFQEELIKGFESNEDVVIDNTNLRFKYRKQYYELAKKYGYKVKLHIIPTTIDTILERCEKTNFPKDVLMRMLLSYDLIDINSNDNETLDSLGVEFEKLIEREEGKKYESYHNKTLGYNQLNQHHSLPLDEHMEYSGRYAVKEFEKSYTYKNISPEIIRQQTILTISACCHDIGKPYCQSFKDNGQATYIGHDKVGAYILYSLNIHPTDNILNCACFLVSTHMLKFQEVGTKSAKKMAENMLRLEIDLNTYKLLCYADVHSKNKERIVEDWELEKINKVVKLIEEEMDKCLNILKCF